MAVLPDAWLVVLNVLLEGPTAWRAPSEIAEAIGRDVDETMDLLCELDVAGWLAIWETESGPQVTLSPVAAERLGARLVEIGPGETPRWARANEPDPPAPRAKNVCSRAEAAKLDFVEDPYLPIDEHADRGERIELHARALADAPPRSGRAEELPRPTVLVGLSLSPWPGPGEIPGACCPACGGQTLRPQMYCLCCDRWGFDRWLADVAPAAADVPQRAVAPRCASAQNTPPSPPIATTPIAPRPSASASIARRGDAANSRHDSRPNARRN